MNERLLKRFREFHGQETRQIGKYFGIPASISTALRLCGVQDCSQQRIRDEWYAENYMTIEPNIDDLMRGVDFDLFKTLQRRTAFTRGIDKAYSCDRRDTDPFELSKADLAIDFIESHLNAEHPVIVSTWNRVPLPDVIEIQGFQVWLVLGFDRSANHVTVHDPGTDELIGLPISEMMPITLNGEHVLLDVGLRGRITHSDYSCLAIWNEDTQA